MNTLLKKYFEFYLNHQDELVEKYNGRVIVIKNNKVIGDYDTELDAINETKKQYEPGTFLVQRCTPGENNYTATYYSRVDFI